MSKATSKYYKTNNQATLDAWQAYEFEKAAFIEECKAMQNHFGAEDFLISQSISRKSFAGLVFSDSKDTAIWTRPDKFGIQKPRAISSVKNDVRAYHAELIDDYKAWQPKRSPDYDPVLNTIGLKWSDFFLGGCLEIFFEAGFLYCFTNRPVADHLIEILASEFESAELAKPATSATPE